MFFNKLFSHLSRTIPRTSLLSAQRIPQPQFHNFSNQFHSLIIPQSTNKLIPVQVNFLCPFINSSTPKFGFSSSSSNETEENKGINVYNGDSTNDDSAKTSEETKDIDQPGQTKPADQTKEPGSISDSQTVKIRSGLKQTASSDSYSESESYLTRDDLIKLISEMEELFILKHKEIEKIQDKFRRTYAEMGNLEKFDIQNFAKSFLDVADNVGRDSSIVKKSVSKINTLSDSAEASKYLKTLLEDLKMIEKQHSEASKSLHLLTAIDQLQVIIGENSNPNPVNTNFFFFIGIMLSCLFFCFLFIFECVYKMLTYLNKL